MLDVLGSNFRCEHVSHLQIFSPFLQEVMVVMMGQAECSTIFPNSIDSSMMCIRRKTGPNLESTCNVSFFMRHKYHFVRKTKSNIRL